MLEGECDGAEVLVVEPPRKGLAEGLLRWLTPNAGSHLSGCHRDLKRVIYVSCGQEAFEKDCRSMLASGLWELVSADGFELFPGSDHLETVAVFDRR